MEFGGHIYQQIVGILIGTNCAPLMADLFLYSHEADCVQHLQKSKFKKQKTSLTLTFCYKDDVLSLNNPKFNDYSDVIYQIRRKLRLKTILWRSYTPHHRLMY